MKQQQAPQLIVIQTCVPDYRMPFFQELKQLEPALLVAAGGEFFTEGISTVANSESWIVGLRNLFFLRRNLVWQHGALEQGLQARVLVVEWNPRVLSNWVLLILRSCSGRKTLLWGHARSRLSIPAIGQVVRGLMTRFADGIVSYTATEAIICRRKYPGMPVWSAPNSSIKTKDIGYSEPGPDVASDVIYVGRLTSMKKVRLLLEAWGLISAKVPPQSRLILIGDGPERHKISGDVRRLGLESSVFIIGHTSDPIYVKEAYRKAVVAVSPGYVGLAAIQSLAYGVPIAISRDEPHSPEIEACIEDFNCRFFKTDDARDLAEVISSFYAERRTWFARRREICESIASSYTVERMAQGFVAALAGLAPDVSQSVRAVLVWEQYGPYHVARLRAFQQNQRELHVLALEIASKTITYAWRREQPDFEIHSLSPERPVEDLTPLSVYRRAVRFFKRAGIQVVFVPGYWPSTSLAVLLAARRVGARAVMMSESHEHTSRAAGIRGLIKRRLVRSFDAALVGGTLHRRYFEHLGMPIKRIFDGYDTVDNNHFTVQSDHCRNAKEGFRLRYGLPERYFLNVGRMETKKNLKVLLDAYAIGRARVTSFAQLVMVGDGSLEQELRTKCVDLGLSYSDMKNAGKMESNTAPAADVLFYGFRQSSETPVFFGLAMAFILPSLWEEWGLVVNEAMAAGLPVIVSRVAGCAPDLVRHSETGFAFDPENADELAGYLVQLNESPELVLKMGKAARELVAEWGCDRFARNARLAGLAALRG